MSTENIEAAEVVDGQEEFDADLAYLKGLAEAIFAYAPPRVLMRIAAFDGDRL